jgi:hypothetical protein
LFECGVRNLECGMIGRAESREPGAEGRASRLVNWSIGRFGEREDESREGQRQGDKGRGRRRSGETETR